MEILRNVHEPQKASGWRCGKVPRQLEKRVHAYGLLACSMLSYSQRWFHPPLQMKGVDDQGRPLVRLQWLR